MPSHIIGNFFMYAIINAFTPGLPTVQHIADAHFFRCVDGDGDDFVTLQKTGENTAGDGVAVQPQHQIDNGGPVAHPTDPPDSGGREKPLLRPGYSLQQFFRKIGGLINPLHKIQPWVRSQFFQPDLLLPCQRSKRSKKRQRLRFLTGAGLESH